MNNAFNFSRFGRYLSYDIKKAFSSSGISIMILGLMPVIVTVFEYLVHILGVGESPVTISGHLLFPVMAVYNIVIPARCYGEITDRKAGSNWLMVPASKLEKFVSMLVVMIIVLPALLVLLFLGSDALLSLIPGYGSPMSLQLGDTVKMVFGDNGMEWTKSLLFPTIFEENVISILFFLLGAVLFKRRKIGCTILSYVLVSIALGLVIMLAANIFVGKLSFTGEEILSTLSRPLIISIYHVLNIIAAVLIGFFIWRRIKTIQL